MCALAWAHVPADPRMLQSAVHCIELLWPSQWVSCQLVVIINIPLLTSLRKRSQLPAVRIAMELAWLSASFLLVSVFALCGKYSLNFSRLSCLFVSGTIHVLSIHCDVIRKLHVPLVVAKIFSLPFSTVMTTYTSTYWTWHHQSLYHSHHMCRTKTHLHFVNQ